RGSAGPRRGSGMRSARTNRNLSGPRRAFRGGAHRHHLHRHRRGGFYFGAPYYYGIYGPSYYYDDFYYAAADDSDDSPVVSYDADTVGRFAARYHSFDRATGTFLHTSGVRKLCPYVR